MPFPLIPAKDDNPESASAWATFIGIVICLCGNVIISFALNIQRLAHERIQTRVAQNQKERQRRESQSSATLHHRHYGTTPSKPDDRHPERDLAPGREDDDEGEEGDDGEGTQYLRSKLWWTGLILMAIGETGNFVACTFPSFFFFLVSFFSFCVCGRRLMM